MSEGPAPGTGAHARPGPAAATGATAPFPVAVWLALLALLAARAVTATLPSMWLWGLNVQRFLQPMFGAALWLACALPLLPRVGERLAGACERLGDRLVGGGIASAWFALGGALLVWWFPDRTWITGDFLLRQGSAESGAFAGNFGHSLPLEIFLNGTLPGLFPTASNFDPNVASRVIGALSAAALALVAVRLARAWSLGGAAALVAASTVFFGGYLCVFTGLGKPAAVLCVLAALALLGAIRLTASARGGWVLALALATAFLTHRSAAALVPLWLAAVFTAWRRHRPLDARGRLEIGAALALPLAAAIAVGPFILRIFREFDLPSHIATVPIRHTGPLAAAFAPAHLLDLANLLIVYSPAPIAAGLVVAGMRPRASIGAPAGLALGLALSFVPLLLFIHPIQGVFRDLEMFAPAGLALAMLAAYVLGRALQERRLPRWIAPALLAAALFPTLEWLVHFRDTTRGIERARAFAVEAPGRAEDELAQLWDLIAYRAFRLRQWDGAVEACERSAGYAPQPRALLMLAIARTYAGDHAGAERVYAAMVERFPEQPLGWIGLAGAALRTGDRDRSARAMARLDGYDARGREFREIRELLRAYPEVWPERGQIPTPAPGAAAPSPR